MNPRRISTFIVGLLYATFVIQNTQVVEVRFLFWSTQISTSLILAGTFVLGFVLGRVWSWIRRKKAGVTTAETPPPITG